MIVLENMTEKTHNRSFMTKREMVDFLYEVDKSSFEPYFKQSYSMSPEPRAVGTICLSNICEMSCEFCAYRKANELDRFILSLSDSESLCDLAVELSLGEVILESGVLPEESYPILRKLLERLKRDNDLKFYLDIGSETLIRHPEPLGEYSRVFIDYVPTSQSFMAELGCFSQGKELENVLAKHDNIDIYSNYIVDLPGQSFEDMAEDIIRLCDSDLRGIKISPFLPQKGTEYGIFSVACLLTTLKVITLVRLRRPDWDIFIDSSRRHLDYEDSLKQAVSVGSNVVVMALSLSSLTESKPPDLKWLNKRGF